MKSFGSLLFGALLMGQVGCAVSSRHLADTTPSPPVPSEVAVQTSDPPAPAVSQPTEGCFKLALRDLVQSRIQEAKARGDTASGLLANPVLFWASMTERLQNKEGETKQQIAEDPAGVQQPQTLNWTRTLRVMRGLTGLALRVVGGPAVVPFRVAQVLVRQSRESFPQETISWRVLRVGLGVAGVFGPGDVLVDVLDAYRRQQRLGCRGKSPSPAADQGEPLPLVTFTRAVSQPHFVKLDGTS